MATEKLKIYGDQKSQPTRAVMLFCKLNGIEFEEITIELFNQEHLSTEFEEINPVKEIPVIFHGDFKLFERYPADLKRRGLCFTHCWIGIIATYDVVQVLDEEEKNKIFAPYKKVQQWIENTKNATRPHFDDVHKHLLFEDRPRFREAAGRSAN